MVRGVGLLDNDIQVGHRRTAHDDEISYCFSFLSKAQAIHTIFTRM